MKATATFSGCNASENSSDFVAKLGIPTPSAINHDAPFVHVSYDVIVEQADGNLAAYIPAVLGCVSVDDTEEQVQTMIDEALQLHLDGMICSNA